MGLQKGTGPRRQQKWPPTKQQPVDKNIEMSNHLNNLQKRDLRERIDETWQSCAKRLGLW